MKPETIIKKVREEFLINENFEYHIKDDVVVFPLVGINSFSSRSIARCHFPYWITTYDCLYVHFNNI